ncbi:MAG: hypothetical protein ACE5DW_01265 [Thermodesulfobacteriota bacterium]
MKSARLLGGGFQLKFWLKYCVLTAAGFTALALCLYLVTGRDLGRSYGEAIYAIEALRINIFSIIAASVYSIAIMVLTVVFIALASIFFSHKMAGPIFRLTRDLELLASGDLTVETSFRKSDQFSIMATEKNLMTERLKVFVTDSREVLTAVQARCEDIRGLILEAEQKGGGGAGVDGEIAGGLQELALLVEQMHAKASRMKTVI